MGPVDPRLLRLSRTTRRYLVWSVALGSVLAVLVVAQARLLANVIGAVFESGAGLAGVRGPMLALLAVVVARGAVVWTQEWAAHRSSAAVKSQLRVAVLARLVRGGPVTRDAGSTGAVATLVTRGVDALDGYFARYLPQLVLAAVVPLAVVVQLLASDWKSGLVVALTLPLLPVFMVLIGLYTQRDTRRHWQALSVLAGHFLDVVAGLGTLKVFGRAKAQTDSIRRVSEAHRSATLRTLRVAFLSSLVLELVSTLSIALVAVGVGLRVLDGSLDLTTGLVVLVLVPEAYLPLRNLGASFHASAEGLTAAGEIFALLELPAPARGTRTDVPDPASSPIRVEGLRVDLPDRAATAFRDLDLTLSPGEIVALTGPSGAGKSTLLSVLMGQRLPDAGTVRVGSSDLFAFDPDAWRGRVAWLPQRPHLFAGSIADNVRLGVPDATDEQVRHALVAAQVNFVDTDSAGAATEVGRRNTGLSAGQLQRVALARLLLRVRRYDTGLLLLDEPTAHLDGDTEKQVVAALLEAAARRTVLVVSHRPVVLDAADRVVRMDLVPDVLMGAA